MIILFHFCSFDENLKYSNKYAILQIFQLFGGFL